MGGISMYERWQWHMVVGLVTQKIKYCMWKMYVSLVPKHHRGYALSKKYTKSQSNFTSFHLITGIIFCLMKCNEEWYWWHTPIIYKFTSSKQAHQSMYDYWSSKATCILCNFSDYMFEQRCCLLLHVDDKIMLGVKIWQVHKKRVFCCRWLKRGQIQ